MTRKGAKQNNWSVTEERFLIENAGILTRREICMELKRSRSSVEQKAHELRSKGISISLRCYKPKLSTCPSCGCLRSRLGRDGICEPCKKRRQLQRINDRTSDLLALIPEKQRAIYADTQAETQSAYAPMPRPKSTEGLSRCQRAKAMEAYEIALEKWSNTNLKRQVKAAQKRKERIEKKVRNS